MRVAQLAKPIVPEALKAYMHFNKQFILLLENSFLHIWQKFRVTNRDKDMSSYTRGYNTTLVHDVRTSFWSYQVNFDVIFRQPFRRQRRR